MTATDSPELLWAVDDAPSRRFPIYTRGNTGEVYPNVITPLCGSIVKGPIAAGQQKVFVEMGAVVPGDLDESDCAVLTGCFGGYLYANLSIGRLMGARAPGMKPGDVDTQMFGTSDAPPYRRQPGDRNLRASMRLATFMTRALRGSDFGWLDRERDEIAAWVASRPSPATATPEELLATVDGGAARLAPLMRSLILASAYGGVAASVIERLAAKADPTARARTAVGVGNVESAGPAAMLWTLSEIVAASPALTAAFDAPGSVAARIADMDVGDDFRKAWSEFLVRYGSRGPDEWELASDTWGTDPDIALAAVDRLRHANAPDPVKVAIRLAIERAEALANVARSVPAPVRGLFRRAAVTVADGAAGRELAKGTIMLAAYPMRLALFELVRRAQQVGGAPDERRDCWLVTRDELEAFIDRPRSFADVIAERREQRDLLQTRVPPFVFEGVIPHPTTWPLRGQLAHVSRAQAGDRLTGIGVSPGRAQGRVRIITNPADPSALEPGEVLVAPITDPAWTPLFLVASAVVCDVGANLSHAAIVARELGIPAVVAVTEATQRLYDGAIVDVDGAAGSVIVLAND